jgi:predicted SprT family Zn-dependent metalloprotease
MSKGQNGFQLYESACDEAWIYTLNSSYYKIRNRIYNKTGKTLTIPKFEINADINSKWGSWNPNTRVMTFSASLLRNFEWAAVEHVMKHEIAHQIVSEIFDMDSYGVAHGEAWKRSCVIVDIEPKRCDSHEFLSSFKGTGSSPMVSKVRKIIIHANNKACTDEEAELFMRKAKELMLRHDIEMKDVMGKDRVWVRRPFGLNYTRWPAYMWRLGNLLKEHYDVESIRTHGPLIGNRHTSRLELFGEPDKLDIAEYVGHALLNQAEALYILHRDKRAEKRKKEKEAGQYQAWTQRKLSKRAFIEGVILGYSQKLKEDTEKARQRVGEEVAKERAEKKGSKYIAGDCAMIPTYNKQLLNEMYNQSYPNMINSHYAGSRGDGRGAGLEAGNKLTLSQGIKSGGNQGRLLT